MVASRFWRPAQIHRGLDLHWISRHLVCFPSMLLFGAGVFLYIGGDRARLMLPRAPRYDGAYCTFVPLFSLSLQRCRLCGTERRAAMPALR